MAELNFSSQTKDSGVQLPVEIIERIIDSIAELQHHFDKFYPRDRYPIWKACAITCRAMTTRSQYWLFRDIFLDKESQATALITLLRRNPIIGGFTTSLTIWGPMDEEHLLTSSWMSWVPLLMVPRMKNLEELYLYGDIFTNTHPSFSQALTAFRSINKLEIYQVRFSSFGHCPRLIRAYPRLRYLRCLYPKFGSKDELPSARPLISNSPRRPFCLHHLDIWTNMINGYELVELSEWIQLAQPCNSLQSLSIQTHDGRNQDAMLNVVLQCSDHSKDIFLEFSNDPDVSALSRSAHLEALHIHSQKKHFPIAVLTSAISSVPSKELREVYVHIDSQKTEWDEQDPEDYKKVDDILATTPGLADVQLIVRLFASRHPRDAETWRQRLVTLFPKISTLERLIIRRTSREQHPTARWSEFRCLL